MQVSNSSAGLAFDPSLANIKKYTQNSASQIEAASQQFEAIFLQMVLQQMHAGTEALSSDKGMFGSSSMNSFREMYDSQLAQHLSGQQQLGFAQAINEQLGSRLDNFEKKFNESNRTDASNKIEDSIQPLQDTVAFQQPLWVL